MVHGILAARRDAVPEAIECADGPPPLLAGFSSPPGTMNRGGHASKRCGSIAQGNDGRDEAGRA
jgi:hypothetical protein